MYRQWVPCGRNSSYSFPPLFWNSADAFCIGWGCACGLGIILWLFFLSFSALWTWYFFTWNATKVYRQWVPSGRNSSYSFPPLFWNSADAFCIGWRCACGLGIILWLFFLSFSALWTWYFFTWNAIKVYRQWVPCGRSSSYSFPLIILKVCRCFLHGMKMCFVIIMSPTKGKGDILFLVRILLASALSSAWYFLVCTISHEPVGGF